ncbi:MAG: ParM/StbA family protein [Candidatus Heimdallarchaeota archaeon]|nr:ParM/StbA family protein [Candidatus Heimdallarchaeota archaeon]MCK5048087.1 ParM/StbA family protein [Candidatus Heimdallarchaeota archaeon]
MPIESMIKTVGLDLGTSTIKISCGDTLERIPSLIGSPTSGWSSIGSSDKSLINNLVIEENGRQMYVGELARLQSEVRRPLASEGRMKSTEDASLAIKAALGLLVEGSHENVIIATGVPVATSQEESAELSRSLTGTQNIKVINDATKEVKQITVNVQKCFVLPEPYGSYYFLLKEMGIKQAVDAIIIDIGFGSTDILTMYSGRIMRTASGSLQEATDTLTNRLSRYLQEQTGKIIRPFDLMGLIESSRRSINIAGQTYEIGDSIDYFVKEISQVILDETIIYLNNLPPDAWIEKVIICGGGAYIFGDALKELLEEQNVVGSQDEILIPENPTMTNSLGFELIASARQ